MEIKIKKYLLLLTIVFCSLVIKAQTEPMAFSLYEATQFAMEHSYILQNTNKDITTARKKVWETISTGLPQVSGTANYNMFLNLPVSLIPAEFVGGEPGTYIPVKFGQDYNSDFGLSVSQQIFDGSWIVGVSSAELYVNLARQAHEKTEIDIRDAVSQAYYMVLISERYKIVMEENLANTQKLYDETKVYYENGFREQQDVDQLKILLKTAENEVSRSERELKIANTVLKYTMGYQLEKKISLTDNLDIFVLPLVKEESPVAFDYNQHIDYKLAISNFQVSEKLLKLEKSTFLPRVSAFYSYTKTSYSNEANLFKEEWYPSSLVGLQASIPIFNSGEKHSKVQQAKIELEKAETDLKYAEITLQKDYITATAEMETAIDKFKNDQESRDLARSILDKTHIKFNNGMISSAELSQQETQYINAFQALVSSTMQLLQADLKLKKAVGAL
ncbi:TolC family protein [Prolixibacteraceae bacterium Z1-6]|uniref:TolC family protein n=1 Tax=Draconibacterium aestuarii TaxID=2998507 RepID=A0A9X3J8G6_9BACT|nr:TolC family protein [Prolixibacteraceae bacterium Z1-6]